jgi:hypothetical protein
MIVPSSSDPTEQGELCIHCHPRPATAAGGVRLSEKGQRVWTQGRASEVERGNGWCARVNDREWEATGYWACNDREQTYLCLFSKGASWDRDRPC